MSEQQGCTPAASSELWRRASWKSPASSSSQSSRFKRKKIHVFLFRFFCNEQFQRLSTLPLHLYLQQQFTQPTRCWGVHNVANGSRSSGGGGRDLGVSTLCLFREDGGEEQQRCSVRRMVACPLVHARRQRSCSGKMRTVTNGFDFVASLR